MQLSGVIDDTLDTLHLVEGSEGVVAIDLEGVTRITSFGVRAWVSALSMLQPSYLGFINCHPSIVTQFNMVSGFGGHGQLVSFYLPYVCGGCRLSFEKLCDVRKSHRELFALEAPAAACPRCGGEGVFDDLPESYFAYVAAAPLPQSPPAFDALLAGARPDVNATLKVHKEFNGRFTALRLAGHLDGRDPMKRVIDDTEGPVFVSLGCVTRHTPEGLDRVVELVRRAPAEVVLGDVPLELVQRVASDATLLASGRVSLWSVRAALSCEAHGEMFVSVEARLLGKSAPAHGACPSCGRPSALRWSEVQLAAAAKLPVAERTDALDALLKRPADARPEKPQPSRFGPGALVMGAYQQVRALGAGRMAEVFLARQTARAGGEVEKIVVVKRILPGFAVDRGFVDMFLTEARRAAQVSHPNVVQIHEVGSEDEQFFIVMEYVAGLDLSTLLERAEQAGRPCPVPVAARIAAGIAAGLHAAHTSVDAHGAPQPIIHRDLGPHNVIVSRDGAVKVTDFGIARAAEVMMHTPTSLLKGNTPYIAPELIRGAGAGAISPQNDVFAAGLVLYQLLTSQHPFQRDSELSTFAALIEEEAPPPSARRREAPVALDAIVARAIAKSRDHRYPDARALAVALEGSGVMAGDAEVAAWVQALEQVGSPLEPEPPPPRAAAPHLRLVGKA
ncbi:MAG: serine/threonine protein kinase [Archangiaceae bacterium]|nr:serine/threonine protein kinase [Archangiaceae bacterium]